MIDFFSAVLGAAVAWLVARQAAHEDTRKVVGELYDKLVDYRRDHPEVLTLARRWRPECLSRIYNQTSEDDRSWAIYYGYVELVLGYCSFVLVLRRGTFLGAPYTRHHKALVKLLLTEHYPIVRDLTAPGGFTSPLVIDFISEQANGGWNWQKEHEQLNRTPDQRKTERTGA